MNSQSYQEALQMLRRAGFGEAEVAHLYQLRQTYLTSELDQPPLDLNRLQFARWLVTTRRLTEELPGANGEIEPPRITLRILFHKLLTRLGRKRTVEP